MNSPQSCVIAFTKDWDDVPTCTTHVLRGMAQQMPVLWINSVGMRRPRVGSTRDVNRVMQRFQSVQRGAVWKENQLRVLSPLVVPRAQSKVARFTNRQLLRWAINREMNRFRNSEVEIWTFVPNAVDYVGCFGEKRVVYYCVDDWSQFTNLDQAWIKDCEQRLLARADVVFATSRYLEDKCRKTAGAKVHYCPHGVSYDKFSAALADATAIPPDLAKLPRPRIGFYGNVSGWVDIDLLQRIALKRPAWSFVMIGPVYSDISSARGIDNIHFLGRRDHDRLPSYCKGIDVGIIPYKLSDPRMLSVNPVKLRELLAAGVPVVTSDLPEVRGLSSYAAIANGADEFVSQTERFLGMLSANPGLRSAISAERRNDDWSRRIQQIRRVTDNV